MVACASDAASERISDSSDATPTSSTSSRCAAPEDASALCGFPIRCLKGLPDATQSSSPTSKSPIPAFQVDLLSFQMPFVIIVVRI